MKKTIIFLVMGFLLILSVNAISAKTLITGKIYNADYTNTISGATVTVVCNGNTLTTESRADGSYNVEYSETGTSACKVGHILTVSAVKGDLYGSNSGEIHKDVFESWDLAVVNVPLVPEFGLIVGMFTLLGAVGVFFVVRKQ